MCVCVYSQTLGLMRQLKVSELAILNQQNKSVRWIRVGGAAVSEQSHRDEFVCNTVMSKMADKEPSVRLHKLPVIWQFAFKF